MHHASLPILVLTGPRGVSCVLTDIHLVDFLILVEPSVEVLDLSLDVAYLAHVDRLVEQMLSLDLLLIHHLGIGAFAGSRVVALSWLRGIPLLLLLVVLAHYAHLLLLHHPAFAVAGLLHR